MADGKRTIAMPDPAVTHAEMIAAVRRVVTRFEQISRVNGDAKDQLPAVRAALALLERHERVMAVAQAARALSFEAVAVRGICAVSIVTAGDTNALTDAIAALDAAEGHKK